MCQNNLGVVPFKVGLDSIVKHLEVERSSLMAWSELAETGQISDVVGPLSEVAENLANAAAKLTSITKTLDEVSQDDQVTITLLDDSEQGEEKASDHEHPHAHGDDHSHIHKHDEDHHHH